MLLYYTQTEVMDPTHQAILAGKGWIVSQLRLRKVVFLPDPGLDLDQVDVVMLTSKQAARWWMKHHPDSLLPLAVVGQATSSLLPRDRLLFPDAPAHGEALVARLREYLPAQQRLLFLRGQEARESYGQELMGHGLRQVVVYRTEKILEKSDPLQVPCMVYFQAPSTVADYQEAYRIPPSRIAVIGPATAESVRQLGWQIDFQPSRPETLCFVTSVPRPADLGTVPQLDA